jgi:hypothetical protein
VGYASHILHFEFDQIPLNFCARSHPYVTRRSCIRATCDAVLANAWRLHVQSDFMSLSSPWKDAPSHFIPWFIYAFNSKMLINLFKSKKYPHRKAKLSGRLSLSTIVKAVETCTAKMRPATRMMLIVQVLALG